MKNYLLFLSMFLSVICYSQPAISWQKSLGGSYDEVAQSIQQTADGGYIVAGYSNSNDGNVTGNHNGFGCYNCTTDYWIVKLTNNGIIEWQKSLGGTGRELVYSIQQTTDGGYIIAGYSNSNDRDVTGNHGGNDYWIVKLTGMGIIEWQKSLGGAGDDWANSLQQTTDGGFIIAGISFSNDGDVTGNHGMSDYWVVKLTNQGIIEWQKSLGGTGDEAGYSGSIQQTSDGGYVFAGYSSSNDGDVSSNFGSYDYWIVKLTDAGTIQWQKSLGGTSGDYACSIRQTTDGGYIVAGYSDSKDLDVKGNHGGQDCWIVKLTNKGIIEWQKSLGGTGNETAGSIMQTTDGGYVFAGYSTSKDCNISANHGYYDYWIVKLTNIGNIEWQKCLGGTLWDDAKSIQQTTDGGYVIAGRSRSNNGDVIYGYHGGYDYWIVKLDNNTLSTDESTFENLFSVYPNPANSEIHVNTKENTLGLPYNIYDQFGRSIMTGKLNGQNSIIETGNLSKGVYILSVGDQIKTNRKIIKE